MGKQKYLYIDEQTKNVQVTYNEKDKSTEVHLYRKQSYDSMYLNLDQARDMQKMLTKVLEQVDSENE